MNKQQPYCCDAMKKQLEFSCSQHPDPKDCPNCLILYSPRFRNYGMPVRTGENNSANSTCTISYCPWCGTKLPKDLTEELWRAFEEAGFKDPDLDTLFSPKLPSEFTSDEWWKKRGL